MRTRCIAPTAHLCCCNSHPNPPLFSLLPNLEPVSQQVTVDYLGLLLDKCASPSLLLALRRLHSQLLTRGILRPNPALGIKLMRAYSSCGDTAATRQVFDGTADAMSSSSTS